MEGRWNMWEWEPWYFHVHENYKDNDENIGLNENSKDKTRELKQEHKG
jgi:hypothetical protein